MNHNEVIVDILCPVEKVFNFTTDPRNTPIWISEIVWEAGNQKVPGIGSIYHNQDINDVVQKFIVTELKQNRSFGLERLGDDYFCLYEYTQLNNITRLRYTEGNRSGKPFSPLSDDCFLKLKEVLEQSDNEMDVMGSEVKSFHPGFSGG